MNNKIFASDFMPKDQSVQNELIKRAKILAIKHDTNNKTKTSLINYIRFTLGKNEFYGIPYEKIKEVTSNFMLTPIPNLPASIAGIINLHGFLIAVIDLKILFSIPHTKAEENPQMIIVSKGSMNVGIIVDNIIGNNVYDSRLLDSPMLSQSISPECILGIHQGTTAIINIESILDHSHLPLDTKSQAI